MSFVSFVSVTGATTGKARVGPKVEVKARRAETAASSSKGSPKVAAAKGASFVLVLQVIHKQTYTFRRLPGKAERVSEEPPRQEPTLQAQAKGKSGIPTFAFT